MTGAERRPTERWNFATLLVQAVARRVANDLSSEKLVLPFLYTAMGGAVLYAGLFAPVIIVAKLLAQLLGARLVEITRQGKQFLAASMVLTATILVCLAVFRGDLPTARLPVLFAVGSACLGLSNGFGTLVFQDMIGRVLGARARINLLFAIGACSGFVVIVATVGSQLVAGFSAREEAAGDHIHLIWTSAGILAVSALAALAVRESGRAVPAAAPDPAGASYIRSLYASSRKVLRLAWFRRFVLARVLFLSVEITMPFFAVHAATFHARTAPQPQHAGDRVQPRRDRGWAGLAQGQQEVDPAGPEPVLARGGSGCGAGAREPCGPRRAVPLPPCGHDPLSLLWRRGHPGWQQGLRGRLSTDEERPYCIAISNLAAGIVGIGMALVAGTISQFRGVIAAIVIMGALNLAAAAYAMTLRDVHPGASDLRSAG